VFKEYAQDAGWVFEHLGQFAAAVIIFGGLIVLSRALAEAGSELMAALLLAATVATAASLAILQAIDGVALKHAVDTWAAAPASLRAQTFADAELVRSLEWGANAFFRLCEGLTVAVLGIGAARAGLVTRFLGQLGQSAGAGFLATGVIVADAGFTNGSIVVSSVADGAFLGLGIGLLMCGRRASGGNTSRPRKDIGDTPCPERQRLHTPRVGSVNT